LREHYDAESRFCSAIFPTTSNDEAAPLFYYAMMPRGAAINITYTLGGILIFRSGRFHS